MQRSGGREDTLFFSDWIGKRVLIEEHLREAKEVIVEAEHVCPAIKRYRTTPQTPPWHAEGPVLYDHVERMLATIFAIVSGASLADIEELARHKEIAVELDELTQVIREEAGTMIAYALVHDIAKPDTLILEAPNGSRGAREGFVKMPQRVATEKERGHYLKLLRAFSVKHPEYLGQRLSAAFYDEYEIVAHNYGHDREGGGVAWAEARTVIGDLHRLDTKDMARIGWMTRNHIHSLSFFEKSPQAKKFDLLVARAVKEGFDPDEALDMLAAGVFLDMCAGSLKYEHGKFSSSLDVIVHFLQSERETIPERAKKRREELEMKNRMHRKRVLEAVGLGSEEVFALLGTPFGRERGVVTEAIQTLLAGGYTDYDFGRHRKIIVDRIEQAKELLTKEKRP